jgi:hypothetical protein
MKRQKATIVAVVLALNLVAWSRETARGNGGPFIVKYPGGDPAAKGVLARLDPSLLPARETRLRVVKEDLQMTFAPHDGILRRKSVPPLVTVSAEYTIENPTGQQVTADFGFPILRGIYISPRSMVPRPDVWVTVRSASAPGDSAAASQSPERPETLAAKQGRPQATLISNSAIYGIIRARAREVIDKGIASDPGLAALIATVRRKQGAQPVAPGTQQVKQASYSKNASISPSQVVSSREALEAYVIRELGWNPRDAILMVEYASLNFGAASARPFDRWLHWGFLRSDKELSRLASANLGPLAAIGEQKATQFFAQLASRFDRRAAAGYETLFRAWGGDVRERSVDLATGRIRPREVDIQGASSDGTASTAAGLGRPLDPTVYARVDYLDPRANISDAEKQACKRILKNLPVVFTFAPMNLLYYQVPFPASATQVVTVTYRQYAYLDTREPSSYQFAYVVHPASLWESFGPIRVTVQLPRSVRLRASATMHESHVTPPAHVSAINSTAYQSYEATLMHKHEKKGELFVAVDKVDWDRAAQPRTKQTAAAIR